MQALKGVTQGGVVVDLMTVPHAFLREAPLVDGKWIDRYIFPVTVHEGHLFVDVS